MFHDRPTGFFMPRFAWLSPLAIWGASTLVLAMIGPFTTFTAFAFGLAEEAMVRVRPEGRRYVAELSCGTVLPVSGAHCDTLRQAGFLD